MKYIQQLDNTDCGAACLAMIASHFGKQLSIAQIREKSGTDLIGTNVKGLVLAAENYGLKAFAVKGTKESINENLHTPFMYNDPQFLEGRQTEKHHFADGRFERFGSDADIIIALERLRTGDFTDTDLLLLDHELSECVVSRKNLTEIIP